MVILKFQQFLKRTYDVYLFVYTVSQEVTQPETRRKIFGTLMKGFPDLINKVRSELHGVSKKDLDKDLDFITQEMEKLTNEAIEKYPLILINQALVMMCTVYEIFLLHVLDCILLTKPETLVAIAENKIIPLKQVIEARDKEAIVEVFREKVKEHFSRQGIEEKFKIFEKLGIEIMQLFNFSCYFGGETQKMLSGYDLGKLIDIFDKRHDIVHKDALPIKTSSEFNAILDFFQKTGFNLMMVVGNKFKVVSDLAMMMFKARMFKTKPDIPTS